VLDLLGRFLCSETFKDARRELDACEHCVGAFCIM